MDFYYRKKGASEFTLYGSEIAPNYTSVTVELSESAYESGEHEFYAVARMKDNTTASTDVVSITFD